MVKLTNDILEHDIYNVVISSTFPILREDHKRLLQKYLIRIVNVIAICFTFDDDIYDYMYQLKQNNYQDLKWLLSYLLPYIGNDADITKIETLNDIFEQHTDEYSDLNTSEVKYIYSNLQYNRCKRTKNIITPQPFDIAYMEHNFYLLLQTIKTMSHLMMVNWLNVVPYNIITYQDTKIFKNTHKMITNKTMVDFDPKIDASLDKTEDAVYDILSSKIQGALTVECIYNTISVELYENIKNIKWLIYDIPFNNILQPLIKFLKVFFQTQHMITNTGIEWMRLPEDYQKKFASTWVDLVDAGKSNIGIHQLGLGTINASSIHIILKGILMSFNKYYKNMKVAIENGYKVLPKYDKLKNVTFTELIEHLEYIGVDHVYEHIRESLQQFKNTWYGYRMLEDNKTDIIIRDINTLNDITVKNVYNYAKSLVHYVDNRDYIQYPKLWCSLTSKQKQEILKRLNDGYENLMDTWFNIGRYISKLDLIALGGLNNDDTMDNDEKIEAINKSIYSSVRENLSVIVFQALITKGVLTYFKPNKSVTDNNYITKNSIHQELAKTIFKTSDDNKTWTSSYHYLTGLPYKYMDTFTLESQKTYNLFTYNAQSSASYTASALDWVAQIGFGHHFVHNRISFITGSTGVGKSTQVPNLFAYYAKAIEYNNSCRVACSEPRIGPTDGNAKIVSEWFGVPIFDFKNVKDGGQPNKTQNYYVQIQHGAGDGTHTKSIMAPSLKYITDGSLILELSDPMLMEKQYEGTYINKNIYDIIIIDEAHEHNKYIDMLLTLLKLPATYNNSLRVVILSATMDEDEHRYRRYFRDINDNRKYPLDHWLASSKLDRINIDRRFHISPPGATTKHKITDIYMPNSTPLDIITSIMQQSTDGDVLVFHSGQADIDKSIEEFNNNTPSNVIAIPFYTNMTESQKKFVQNIDMNIKYLKIDKYSDKFVDSILTEGSGSYNRAIIVSTNIAEASITLPALKYVVDTGTQKVNKFDYRKRGNILKEQYISESSMKQRRGRVGRKQAGTVYYLYAEGIMKNNKTSYQISTTNMTLDIFKLMCAKPNEKIFLLPEHDPNKPNTRMKYDDHKAFNTLYFTDKVYYDYYGVDSHYDYQNYMTIYPYYQTGYDMATLTDDNGTFYLIHPDELLLKRNAVGHIVDVTETGDSVTIVGPNKIKSLKMNSFYRIMYESMYITNFDKTSYVKTQLGINIVSLMEKLKLEDESFARLIFYSYGFDCYEEAISLMAFYKLINYDIKKLFIRSPTTNILSIDKVKSWASNDETKKSDSACILAIIDGFFKLLSRFDISTNLNNQKYISLAKQSDPSRFTLDVSNYMATLDPTKYKSSMNAIQDRASKFVINNLQNKLGEFFMKDLLNYDDEIQSWCNTIGLNHLIMKKYATSYAMQIQDITKGMSPSMFKFMLSLKKVLHYNNPNYDSKNKLMSALLFAYSHNVVKKIPNAKYYFSLYAPTMNNIVTLPSIALARYIPNTLMNETYLENYLLYLNIDIDKNNISCLHYIAPSLFTKLTRIYMPKMMNDLNQQNTDSLKKTDIGDENLAIIITEIGGLIEEITREITQNYDKSDNLDDKICKI